MEKKDTANQDETKKPEGAPASAESAPKADLLKGTKAGKKPEGDDGKKDDQPAAPTAEKPAEEKKADEKKSDHKPAAEKPAAEAKPAEGEDGKKGRAVIDPAEAHVLVVEDNVPNFVLIARMLAYMGVQRCEWKTSGWQVVEFADTLPRIDLILMDIRLPYEDGFQALEKVRENPRLKDTLVVAVTAEGTQDQMVKAQKAGFDGFLAKPLDPDMFPEQIRKVLSGEQVWVANQ
ncbi:MAG: response regulator [Chloroflexi bacterium]|nr:response regulator [Chloroflexota bacterium]